MNMFKKNGGFTLVELIVVIAILAILAGVAIPAYSGYINNANEAADLAIVDAVKTAAMATMATTGEVDSVYITTTVTDGKNVISSVKINGDITGTGDDTAFANGTEIISDEDFVLYYTGTADGNIDSVLKSGTSAIWNGTEWIIK